MPVLFVYGMPKGTPRLEHLLSKLVVAVSSTKELQIYEKQVSVFFPEDLIQEGLGEELICFVEGLFKKSPRTKVVCQKLADKIADALMGFATEHLTQCECVEVFIRLFNQEKNCFSERRRN